MIETKEGLEFVVVWVCPTCEHTQNDSVHPIYGPFISCTCSYCQNSFDNTDLSAEDAKAWEAARDAAVEEDLSR